MSRQMKIPSSRMEALRHFNSPRGSVESCTTSKTNIISVFINVKYLFVRYYFKDERGEWERRGDRKKKRRRTGQECEKADK